MNELERLLLRITDMEDLVDCAEQFFAERSPEWSAEFTARFEIYLERKRDQIFYEKNLVEKMGWNMALGHWPPRMDI